MLVSQVLFFHQNTYSNKAKLEYKPLFETLYKLNIVYQVVLLKEIQEIKDFLLAACPVKSEKTYTIQLFTKKSYQAHSVSFR